MKLILKVIQIWEIRRNMKMHLEFSQQLNTKKGQECGKIIQNSDFSILFALKV